MGKGDKKTRRGKIYRGSHGNARPHAARVTAVGPSVAAVKAPAKAAATAPAKRTVRRTTTARKKTS